MRDALTLLILIFIYENKVVYLEVVKRIMNLSTLWIRLAVTFSQFIQVSMKKPPRGDDRKVSDWSGFIMDFPFNSLQAS